MRVIVDIIQEIIFSLNVTSQYPEKNNIALIKNTRASFNSYLK